MIYKEKPRNPNRTREFLKNGDEVFVLHKTQETKRIPVVFEGLDCPNREKRRGYEKWSSPTSTIKSKETRQTCAVENIKRLKRLRLSQKEQLRHLSF